jgi:drug/metabolite transporter (DMT)-like permease
MRHHRALPWALLTASALLWAGNWVASRGIRETMPPLALTFWRWLPVALLLAPIAIPALRGRWGMLRQHWRIILLLGAAGVPLFTSFVYIGLQTTEAVNAVILNSSVPIFTLLCSWVIDREAATGRQIAGLAISLAGIMVIVSRGDPVQLLHLQFHRGDAWILLAMPFWGIYSVLLKRRPKGLDGLPLLWVLSIVGLVLLLPFYAAETVFDRAPRLTWGSAGTVLYLGIFASVIAYSCWNEGVVRVGANRAGFMIHLLPVFGTVLAIVFLGETFHFFHAVGIATILVGVFVATAAQSASSGGRTARNMISSKRS